MRARAAAAAAALIAGALGFALGSARAPRIETERSGGGAGAEAAPAAGDSSVPGTPAAGPIGAGAATGSVIRPGPLPEPYSTRLDSVSLDVDGDGAAETVELFAAVERDARGRLMWDDGQRWMLRVREDASEGAAEAGGDDDTGATGYVLFDDRVQLGRLTFTAVERPEEPPLLVLELAAGAGVRVWSLRHDADRGGFVEEASVAASGNVVHRTPLAALE